MTGGDDEFEDFLRRRRPVFRRDEEPLEPPAELDRIVLRQAREAIEAERPQPIYRAPRWAMPVAMAATVLLACTVVLHTMLPSRRPVPTVSVQTIAQRTDYPEAAPLPPPPAQYAAAPAERPRREAPANAAAPLVVELDDRAAARARADSAAGAGAPAPEAAADLAATSPETTPAETTSAEPAPAMAKAAGAPAFRRDPKAWLAEIERLRARGDSQLADAEYAEFKRQNRAYAASPER